MAACGALSAYISFGVIADPQYADKDDGNTEGRVQRYRGVPTKLKSALSYLASDNLNCILFLGDFIDGHADNEVQTRADLLLMSSVLDEGISGKIPAVHVVGNHDIGLLDKAEWMKTLGVSSPFYSRLLAPGWRLIVLDTTDLSLQAPEGSQELEEANRYLEAHPLSEAEPHMKSWNGGIGKLQMEWLKESLHKSEQAGDRVVIATHHPIAGSRPTHSAWNWKEIEEIIVKSHSTVLCLAGHDHIGGYKCVDEVHFVVVEAMLEAAEDGNAYAKVHIHQDHIDIEGHGVTSRKLKIPDRLAQLS